MLSILDIADTLDRNNYTMQHILNTFKAFVEVIIPLTPNLANEYGEIQYYGAVDLLTYEYLIQTLHAYGGSELVLDITKSLDTVAQQFVFNGNNRSPVNSPKVMFSDLVPGDRLSVINRLRQFEINETQDYVVDIDFLIRLTMMGYYSEWYGYGLTRLEEPINRVLEFPPLSWQQIKYPGIRINE